MAVVSCGGSTSPKPPPTNSYGDPYVTDAQARNLRIGQPSQEVYAALGGVAPSGMVPPASEPYDICRSYPVRGRNATWFLCFRDGRLALARRERADEVRRP
jgi:hypothetical protein